jgi:DNA polymerase V
MSSSKVFALIDCNNFYASCERIFDPKLIKKPIVILSNNDGCIIARSNEAKSLGIPMGAPLFKYKDIIKKNDIKVFSSNYNLYGNISNRIMQSIKLMVPDYEIYSIDEAFLKLDNIAFDDQINLCHKIHNNIQKWIGIPTSIGIAKTKTLAKIANRIAKNNLYNLSNNHICDLRDKKIQDYVLNLTAIEDIWGIGNGIAKKLHKIGIKNALELREASSKNVRDILGVVGERIVYELREISCLELEEIRDRKNILSSKSFGRNITNKNDLQEAISNYAVNACKKLRSQKSKANAIYVYIRTNPFSNNFNNNSQYYAGLTHNFILPTNNVTEIIKSSLLILDKIYKTGFAYKKAGVILLDLSKEENLQHNLFADSNDVKKQKSEIIQQTMEKINKNFNNNSCFYAIQGTKKSWLMNCNNKSKSYTTEIDQILLVN